MVQEPDLCSWRVYGIRSQAVARNSGSHGPQELERSGNADSARSRGARARNQTDRSGQRCARRYRKEVDVSSPVPYKYILSLPERVIRSLGALSGGLLREIGSVALPPGIRRTTLYRTMVEVTLRFLIEEVGQVEGVYPYQEQLAQNFLLQRTASHGIELLGILAFRASPVWVLAALADITGGGHKLIQEISAAMKEEGL